MRGVGLPGVHASTDLPGPRRSRIMLSGHRPVTAAGVSRPIGGVARRGGALVRFGTASAAAGEDVKQRAGEVVEVMHAEAMYTEVFDEGFSSRVSQEQFSAIFAQAERQYGPLVGLDAVEATAPTA